MTKRKALGKGLGALIPGPEQEMALEGAPAGLATVPVNAISPNPHQPRSRMEEEPLQELADSIREHGLIQPLIVHDSGDGRYTLIAGERRWRAAQRAGLDAVPVVVKEATPLEMLELALIENIQRADLNPIEEASAYRELIDEFGLTHAEVAKRVGKSRPAVSNTVRLLELPAIIQHAVIDGRISGGHARTLLSLPTPEAQTAVLNSIVANSLSVRQTESLVNKMLAGEKPAVKRTKRKDPQLLSLESQFRQRLGTKVDIQKKGKGGRVVIHYYSDEDLQTIFEALIEGL